MEIKNEENPDPTQPTTVNAAVDPDKSGETTPSAGGASGDAASEETEPGTDGADKPVDPTSPADPGTSSDSGPEDSGTGSGDSGPDDRPDGDGPDGDGPGGDGPGEERPGGDESCGKERQFEDRFLNNGASEKSPEQRRESLAASLIRMALALLTGETPEDRFIPLMDAVIAHEAIIMARAEGEIAGRNAIIEEQLATPAALPPDLNGTPLARSRRHAASIFDLADLAR